MKSKVKNQKSKIIFIILSVFITAFFVYLAANTASADDRCGSRACWSGAAGKCIGNNGVSPSGAWICKSGSWVCSNGAISGDWKCINNSWVYQVPQRCTPNESECKNSQIVKCTADGKGWSTTTCAYGCKNSNECNPPPPLQICSPGQVTSSSQSRCSGNSVQVERCNYAGTGYFWDTTTSCKSDQKCENSICVDVPRETTTTLYGCGTNNTVTAVDKIEKILGGSIIGTSYTNPRTVQECARSGKICRSGVFGAECATSSPETSCRKNINTGKEETVSRTVIVGEKSGTSTTDWQVTQICSASQECKNSQCVEKPKKSCTLNGLTYGHNQPIFNGAQKCNDGEWTCEEGTKYGSWMIRCSPTRRWECTLGETSGNLICITNPQGGDNKWEEINNPPEITTENLTIPKLVLAGKEFTISFFAKDPEGSNITYTIRWGDGQQSVKSGASGQNISASYTYPSSFAGTYSISVTATDSKGAAKIAGTGLTIEKNNPPSASLTLQKKEIRIGESADVAIVTDPNNSADSGDKASWIIDWGDGIKETGDGSQRKSHIYQKECACTIVLTALDAGGLKPAAGDIKKGILIFPLNLAPTAPVIKFPADLKDNKINLGAENTKIFLGFSSIDPDGDNIDYKVEWGEGNSFVIKNQKSGEMSGLATHTYPSATKNYSGTATACDTNGACSPSTSFTIVVDIPKLCTPIGTSCGGVDRSKIKQEDQSKYTGLELIQRVICKKGEVITEDYWEIKQICKASEICKEVKPGERACVAKNTAPSEISFNISAGLIALAGKPVSFEVSAADVDGGIITFDIDWGDGTSSPASAKAGEKITVTHTYAKAGNYGIKITATDSGGLSLTKTSSIKVETPQAPSVSITAPIAVYEGDRAKVFAYIIDCKYSKETPSYNANGWQITDVSATGKAPQPSIFGPVKECSYVNLTGITPEISQSHTVSITATNRDASLSSSATITSEPDAGPKIHWINPKIDKPTSQGKTPVGFFIYFDDPSSFPLDKLTYEFYLDCPTPKCTSGPKIGPITTTTKPGEIVHSSLYTPRAKDYTVGLLVKDSKGNEDSETIQFNIKESSSSSSSPPPKNTRPTASIICTSPIDFELPAVTTTCIFTASDPDLSTRSDEAIWYYYDMGNGDKSVYPKTVTGVKETVYKHSTKYLAPGAYTVTLTVKDSRDEASKEAETTIEVKSKIIPSVQQSTTTTPAPVPQSQPQPTPQPSQRIKKPPKTFNLISPADGTTGISSVSIKLDWEDSAIEEVDSVTDQVLLSTPAKYHLYICEKEEPTCKAAIKLVGNIKTGRLTGKAEFKKTLLPIALTFYDLPNAEFSPLKPNTTYIWDVEAIGSSTSASNGPREFTTAESKPLIPKPFFRLPELRRVLPF